MNSEELKDELLKRYNLQNEQLKDKPSLEEFTQRLTADVTMRNAMQTRQLETLLIRWKKAPAHEVIGELSKFLNRTDLQESLYERNSRNYQPTQYRQQNRKTNRQKWTKRR